MTQNWGSPNYPPRPPQYLRPPQYQQPEDDPNYDDDPPRRSPWVYFLGGGCSMLLLVMCCALIVAAGWVIDARYGITAPKETPIEQLAPAPDSSLPQPVAPAKTAVAPAGTVVAATPKAMATAPANAPVDSVGMGQPIAASSGMQLTVFDLQRGVQPVNLAAADGMEFVAVSVGLQNMQVAGGVPFSLDEFVLQNADKLEYLPDPQADNGRRLNNGSVQQGQSVEGDLLFHVIAEDAPLALVWTPGGNGKSYTVLLQ